MSDNKSDNKNDNRSDNRREQIDKDVYCDMLILQSPWIPVLQDYADTLISAIRQKNIALRILCGSDDEDCLPMAKQLYDMAKDACADVRLIIQENSRHQFPAKLYALKDLL